MRALRFEFTPENIANFLRPEDNLYGQCVFACPNDVCDRQTVSVFFDGGVTANLLMHGFSLYETYRITRVFGSKGKLSGRLEDGTIRLSLFDGTDKIIDVNEEIEDKESHSGGDSKLVADYISYLETGKRPLGISELADSIQSHRLAFGAEEKRLEHPLPKISEAMACEKSVKNKSSVGIYSAVSEFIGKNAGNAVKTISMTVNCRKEDLKEKLESDMAFISSLIGSKVYKCDKITSEKGYPHGFIVTYFENGRLRVIRSPVRRLKTERKFPCSRRPQTFTQTAKKARLSRKRPTFSAVTKKQRQRVNPFLGERLAIIEKKRDF